jgi:lysophospholipase L1-like esterase
MEDPCKIVCFGDSITKAMCPLFEKKLRLKVSDHNVEVINAGVNGETTVDALTRIDDILCEHPDVVVVGFGMNDWRKGVDCQTFTSNMSDIVKKLQEAGIRVILMTMNPDCHNKDAVSPLLKEYNDVIRNVAFDHRIRIADVYSLWMKELSNYQEGLLDEIHPNSLGKAIIYEALTRVVPRSQTVIVWAFNGEYAFCNYKCEYCYVHSDTNMGHYYTGPIDKWHRAYKNSFGDEKLVFYLAFGEPTFGKGFYEVLDMIASEPNWYGHITSNLSASLEKLVQAQLVKDGRLQINASFHPTQVSIEDFLTKLLFLREHGIECPVVLVTYPPFLDKLEEWIEIFSKHNFLVNLRRFRGWYENKFYPISYTDEERTLIAKYCDDATIKYMLNDFEEGKGLKGRLSYAGMYYVFTDCNGDVWTSPDHKDRFLGNLFDGKVDLYTEPQGYGGRTNGSVNGLASLLELNYHELENNFVLSFARQGGVYLTQHGVRYKNIDTDFNDPRIRNEYNFPPLSPNNYYSIVLNIRSFMRNQRFKARAFKERNIYPRLERQIVFTLKFLEKIR